MDDRTMKATPLRRPRPGRRTAAAMDPGMGRAPAAFGIAGVLNVALGIDDPMRIRFIKAEQTHALRQQVLRPAQPVGEMDWGGDRAETSFHLGAEEGEHIVAVASFMQEKHAELRGWKQYRLRGMATLPAFQGMGAGSALVRFGLDHLRGKQVDLVWCHAREKAVGFYTGLGFMEQGAPFLVDGIGMHHLMYLRF
jgi:predicted GNAT family N-acyltransferase